MIDVPKTHHHKPESGCPHAMDRRTDDGSRRALPPVHEVDGSWSSHRLDAPGMHLSPADADALTEPILEPAR